MERTIVDPLPRVSTVGESTFLPASAVSWGAILAGAVGAASLSLILVFLGLGLGMSSISPWAGDGASAKALGIGSIVWVTLTQIAAAALGGYLAGRLRTRWLRTHVDEVYFRDTAHGFLAWAIATLATAALFASTIAGIASGGAKLGAAALGGAGAAATTLAAGATDSSDGSQAYLLDTLFRPGTNTSAAIPADGTSVTTTRENDPARGTAEAARIFANAIRVGSLSAEDTRYLGQVIAGRTGLTAEEGEARVRAAYAEWEKAVATAKEAADKARKATAYAALWLFISLLAGAFFASFCATWGGKRRDLVD